MRNGTYLVLALMAVALAWNVGFVMAHMNAGFQDDVSGADHPDALAVYVVVGYNDSAEVVEYTVVWFGDVNVSIQSGDPDTALAPSTRLNMSGVPTPVPVGGGDR